MTFYTPLLLPKRQFLRQIHQIDTMRIYRVYEKAQRIPLKLLSLYLRSIISPTTKKNSSLIFNKLEEEYTKHQSHEEDYGEIFQFSRKLRQNTLDHYHNLYKHLDIRILIHVPSYLSMGGLSLFENWIDGLKFMGVEASALPWNGDALQTIEKFKPHLFLTSDHYTYLDQIDWKKLKEVRKKNPFLLVFTASLKEDGNTPNHQRLDNAKKQGVDFFVSYRDETYIHSRFQEWSEFNYEIISIPFSANPLIYYYIPGIPKTADYCFLGSSNPDKVTRYYQYFQKILKVHSGYIIGPGWGLHQIVTLQRHLHRLFYQSAWIGINLHLTEQVNSYNEINERTYSLACCGVFQLVDSPKALPFVFSKADSIVSAENHKEYYEKFLYYLNYPTERNAYIQKGLEMVYDGHTIFHRMEKLILYIKNKIPL